MICLNEPECDNHAGIPTALSNPNIDFEQNYRVLLCFSFNL